MASGRLADGLCRRGQPDVPGEQFIDPVDRVICDPFKHVAQVRLWIDSAELA